MIGPNAVGTVLLGKSLEPEAFDIFSSDLADMSPDWTNSVSDLDLFAQNLACDSDLSVELDYSEG